MNHPLKKLLCFLPVMIVMILTVTVFAPSVQAAQLRTPVLNAPVNTATGVQVSWKSVPKAQQYRVFYKSDSSAWKKLIDTKNTSVIHKVAKPGVKYTYTVRCLSKDGKRYTSDFNRTGKTIQYVKAPSFRSFSNSCDGTIISWTSSPGAAKYRILINTSTGWKVLTVTDSTYYLHRAAKDGVAYSYRVQCVNAKEKPISACSGIVRHTCTRLNTSLTNAYFAFQVYSKLSKEYAAPSLPNSRLTRQSAAAILVKALNYGKRAIIPISDSSDPAIQTLTSYGYYIPDDGDCVYPARYISEAERTGMLTDVYRYQQLHGKNAVSFGDSIIFGSGSNKYSDCRIISEKYGMNYVSYAVSGASFGTCDNARAHIVDEILSAKVAKKKADFIFLNGGTNDIKLVSAGNTPDSFDPDQPEKSTFALGFEQSMQQIRQYWGNIPVIYIRAHNIASCPNALERAIGEYGIKIAEKYGAATVDIFSDTVFNTTNEYMRDRYTRFVPSSNQHDGTHPTALGYITFYVPLVTEKLLFTPQINTPVNTANGVQLSWTEIGKSPLYRVFYRSGSSWVKLADTTALTYTHQAAVSGTKYTYTVRCISANGKCYLSDFNRTGKSILYIQPPQISLTANNQSIRIDWSKVAGAPNYRVFVKENDEWIPFADTAGTSAIYRDCISGVEYTFAVRCLSADGKSYLSAFSEPQTIACFDSPVGTSLTSATKPWSAA